MSQKNIENPGQIGNIAMNRSIGHGSCKDTFQLSDANL